MACSASWRTARPCSLLSSNLASAFISSITAAMAVSAPRTPPRWAVGKSSGAITPIAGTDIEPMTAANSEVTHISGPPTAKKIAWKTPMANRPGTMAARRPRTSATRPPSSTPSPAGVEVASTKIVMRSPLKACSVRR